MCSLHFFIFFICVPYLNGCAVNKVSESHVHSRICLSMPFFAFVVSLTNKQKSFFKSIFQLNDSVFSPVWALFFFVRHLIQFIVFIQNTHTSLQATTVTYFVVHTRHGA